MNKIKNFLKPKNISSNISMGKYIEKHTDMVSNCLY